MRRFHAARFSALLAFPALVALGCGGGSTAPPRPTAAGLTAEGWARFGTDSLDAAAARFTDALALDAGYADARTGLGWVALRRDDFQAAETAFAAALSLDSTAVGAMGGRVVAAAGLDDPAEVESRGLALLAAAPGFVFSHDPGYSASDVRWLIARAALDLGDDAVLLAQLDVLAPGNGLDPAAADFPERVLALLESLRGTV